MMRAIRDFYVAEGVVVTGDVCCDAGVNIWFGSVIRGDLARIHFGPRANLQDGCVVHTDGDKPLDIEEGVVVGHMAMLHGSRIGKDSLIGIGAKLLSGSIIGEECLVAAGAVVPEGKVIPPRSVVMGLPGRVMRPIRDEEIERTRRINHHYLELAQRYAQGEFAFPWESERPAAT